jgi:hypothetical protein
MGRTRARKRSLPQAKSVALVVPANGVALKPSEDNAPRQVAISHAHRTVQHQSPYDADREFIQALEPKVGQFNFLSETQVAPDGSEVNWDIQATLFEVSTDGKSYRLAKYPNRKALQARLNEGLARWDALTEAGKTPNLDSTRLIEADSERDALIDAAAGRLQEGFDGGGYYGGDDFGGGSAYQGTSMPPYGSGIDPNAEYIPMMCGPESKQLYQYDMLDMHRKAFEAYNHNPVAHQLCELQTAFVLGRGIDHTSTNEDIDEVWREFVDRTDFYADLENIATDAWWAGELMLEFADDAPQKGYTDYRMIDPSTIWDIITDPEDIQKVFYMRQQYSTAYQMYTKGNIPSMRYVLRDIPANKVLHYKLNVSKYEKRGRSDLFSVLGWLKRLNDLMNARVVKGQLEAAFVWDVTVNSGSEDISRIQLNLPDPYKPGSTFIHNKNLELKPVASDIKGNDSVADMSSLLNMIAVGFGVPKEFIGDASKGGGKSGSLTATEPGVKRFERRQRLIESFCHAVANRVIGNAIKAGRININQALKDARSVTKLAKSSDDLPDRGKLQDQMAAQQEQANQAAQDQQKQQQQNAQEMHDQGMSMAVQDQQHRHSMDKQALGMQHKAAMTALDKPGVKPQINLGLSGVGGPGGPPMGPGGPQQPGAPGQPPQPGQQPQPGQNGPQPQQQQGQQGQQPQPPPGKARESLTESELVEGHPDQLRDSRTGKFGVGVGKHDLSPFSAAIKDFKGGMPPDEIAKKYGFDLREAMLRAGASQDNEDDNAPTTPTGQTSNGPSQNGNTPNGVGNDQNQPLNPDQKKRIALLKKSQNYSKEFLEFIFPSIAQEDRSAKLKDLALAEAMQWLPKSQTAKIAAKELNITTYSFEDSWSTIVEESKLGMSIAHVYTQDNEHVPETSIAQDVQAELAAKQPIAPQNQMVNVPTPPTVAGDKLMPAQAKGGAGGAPGSGTGGQSNASAAPGKAPNSGSTKTNKFSGPDPAHTDPTQKSGGYSAAANNPMANEGKANILKSRQSLQDAIRRNILKEALLPAMDTTQKLASFITDNVAAADALINGEE